MGDIAPYTGLASGLAAAGHQITVVTSNRYAPLFRAHHLQVHALPLDEQEADIGRHKPPRARLENGRTIALISAQGLLAAARKGCDLLLAHPLLHPQAAVIAEGLRLPCVGIYTVSPAMMLPRLLGRASTQRFKTADALTRLALSPMHGPTLEYLRRELGLRATLIERLAAPDSGHPVRYGVSPSLVPAQAFFRPSDRPTVPSGTGVRRRRPTGSRNPNSKPSSTRGPRRSTSASGA